MRFTLRKPDWRGRARRGGFLRSLLGTYPTRAEFPVNLLLVGGFRSLRSLNPGGQRVNRCVGSPTCPRTWLWLAGFGVYWSLVVSFLFGGWGVSCCRVVAVLVVRLGFVLVVVLLAVRRRVWLWLVGIRVWR